MNMTTKEMGEARRNASREIAHLINKMRGVDLYKSTIIEQYELLKEMATINIIVAHSIPQDSIIETWDKDTQGIYNALIYSRAMVVKAIVGLDNLLKFELEKAGSKDKFVLGTSANKRWYKDFEEALQNLERYVVKLDLA